MSTRIDSGLLAIDVGNSCVKLAWYPPEPFCPAESKPSELPVATTSLIEPESTRTISVVEVQSGEFSAPLHAWLESLPAIDSRCYVASVNDLAVNLVLEQLPRSMFGEPHMLSAADLPIQVRVEKPEQVGIDRLLSAVVANRLRERNCPAIVVSLGTACTVNLIASDGAFEGGAILPGIAMAANALHKDTSALPRLSAEQIAAPINAIGKSTGAAISAGLTWGLLGAIRELIDRMSQGCEPRPQLFVTGGEAPQLLVELASSVDAMRHVPNMVLAGVQIVAGEQL